jgi:hypothetical protein
LKTIHVAALACAACCLLGLPAAAATFRTKLFPSQDGIALSRFPGRQVVTKTIQVDRTRGKAAASWTAVSDQPWLTVTPDGITGGNLTVTANTDGLATDKFYSANVAVSTSDADFTDSETLHVGLWVGSTDPSTVQVDYPHALYVATNPVAPVAYVTDGGNSIREFNVYSGAVVATFKAIAPAIGYLEVSSDGGTLFATDTKNKRIVALDANTGTAFGKFDMGYRSVNMAYARPYGEPALYIAGNPDSGVEGSIVAYPSGEVLASGFAVDLLAVTPNGQIAFSTESGVSGPFLYGYSVKPRNGKLNLISRGSVSLPASNCQDMAISHDGKHVYPACGEPYEFDVYSGKTLRLVQTLAVDPFPNNIEIDENDRVVGGIPSAGGSDIFVYNQKGRPLGQVASVPCCQQIAAAMRVSGDGTRVIAVEFGWPSTGIVSFRNMP